MRRTGPSASSKRFVVLPPLPHTDTQTRGVVKELKSTRQETGRREWHKMLQKSLLGQRKKKDVVLVILNRTSQAGVDDDDDGSRNTLVTC